MAIKAGQILHAMNQFIVDRIQTGGAGNLNIPQDRVYELGNFQSVGIVRDVPDLSFSLDCLDVGTQVEALLCGVTSPDDNTAHPAGNGTTVDGAMYDLSLNKPVDIISPFKRVQGDYTIVRGVAVPQLTLESVAYNYGLQQNAGENFTLRGDSIYYVPGTPFQASYSGDGSTVNFPFTAVVGGNVNEVQAVAISGNPTGGTFTLTFGGQTTSGIAYNATPSTVQAALAALSSVGNGNVNVSGTAGTSYTVTFQGALTGTNVAQLTASGSSLTGGSSPAVTVTTSTDGGASAPVALQALTYTEAGKSLFALNVSVDGQRKYSGTDYNETNTGITFITAPANGSVIRVVFGSTQKADGTALNASYTQAVNASLSVKPAAVRGRDILVYVGGMDPANLWHDVQSVQINWSVNIEADWEFGSSHAVARDFVDPPATTGTIEIKSITFEALFAKMYQITGVDPSQVIGPQSSTTVPIVIQLLNPDTGGTSSVPRGTVLKTLFIPDARFVIPGYQGQVSQKMTSSLPFTSDTGAFKVVKGKATKSQLGL